MFSGNDLPHYIKVPFRYGLYAGIIAFPFMLLLYYMGHHPFLIPVFFDYRIALLAIVIFFSLKEARDYYSDGYLYFWQCMAGSLALTFAFATMTSAFLYVYITLNTEFIDSYIDLSLKQISTLSEGDINRIGRQTYMEATKLLRKADAKFIVTRFFVQSFIISLFVSIIISVIVRRRPRLI